MHQVNIRGTPVFQHIVTAHPDLENDPPVPPLIPRRLERPL